MLTRMRQVEMTMRSRRGSAATVREALCTPPGKRRVLPVVRAGHVIPRQTEGVVRDSSRRGPARTDRRPDGPCCRDRALRGVGVHPHGALGRHVDEIRRLDRPLERPCRSKAIGADSTPRNLPISPESAAIGPPAAPLAIAVIASRCSVLARSSAMRPTDQFPLPIASGVNPSTMKPRPSSGTPAVVAAVDLKRHGELALDPLLGVTAICPGMHGHTKVAIASLVVLPAHVP